MLRAFLLRVIHQAIEEFLTPKFDALRDETQAQIDTLRNELKAEIHAQVDGLRREMNARFDGVDGRLDGVERHLADLADDVKSHGVQLARLEQRVIDLKESLDVERRLARLEAHAGLGKA